MSDSRDNGSGDDGDGILTSFVIGSNVRSRLSICNINALRVRLKISEFRKLRGVFTHTITYLMGTLRCEKKNICAEFRQIVIFFAVIVV